jgi:DNA-binding response OmpR family regulator
MRRGDGLCSLFFVLGMSMFKILIIDDDVTLLAHLGTELEAAGYEVLRASDTRNADLLLDEAALDMVLLEIETSRGEGWELLGRAAARLPVIVISGRGLEEDIIQGLDAGAVDYLPKPFRTGELLARMRVRLRQATPAPVAPALAEPPEVVAAPIAPAADALRPAPRRQLGEGDDEAIFIPYGEEHRLMREAEQASSEESRVADLAHLPLGQRLRAARQRKRITLVQAELESKVRMHYIQAMEEEKFALLPRGPISEELLRAYVTYIGVDMSKALEEYRRLHYNAPVEPLAALGGAPLPRILPRWAVWLTAIVLALVVGFGGIWLIDPAAMTTLASRALELVAPAPPLDIAPPAATAAPAPTAPPQP